ncbi:GNAT family N-acetyltransferase [Pandoraea anapnoica]|uniref:GNAT family N-acetyltransferase n=1 Tax=Pandoraea anapnoica TaxID=2508301 RepID=A0A5E4ZIW5_9BURK|nr:GNAT family N-acetyltransferase [Pandoraea anapnoica]VVE60886.1 GNAT family N-acetyltransferase [Pandoraea anapnoica]
MLAIIQIEDLPPQLTDLEREAAAQGFRFLGRLIEEWETGKNRFDKPGERLLVATHSGCLVGIGGLNVDPYDSTGDTARLRRLYVANDFRRRGIGEALVYELLLDAHHRFRVVRLSTDTDAGDAFYSRLGFVRIKDANATHMLFTNAVGESH